MKFAICNEIFQGWKLEDTLAYAARLGYAGVEIAPFTLANSVTDISADERQAMREAAARNGIEIAGIHWVLVKPEGLYINHPDRSLRERTAKYFCDLVDFCADLGGKVMVVGSPKQRNVLPGVSREQAWDWAAATFRQRGRASGATGSDHLLRAPGARGNELHQYRRRSPSVRPASAVAPLQDHSRREGDVLGSQSPSPRSSANRGRTSPTSTRTTGT